MDLVESLELPQCQCLNQCSDHTLKHAIGASEREDAQSFLQSDADEELLISLKFMEAVKISAIQIESGDADTAPSSLKLFVNKVGLDFDSARSEKPTQELTLAAMNVRPGAKPCDLRFVLFQKVSTLDIFIPANQSEGEVTTVSKLVLLGNTANSHEGVKRSLEQQKAATAGDWLK